MIPEGVYHMAAQCPHPRAAFPQVCMESKTGMEEFSSGEAVKAFFVLASVTSSSELCYVWLLPLEILRALALVRPLGAGKETQKDAQD